MQICTTTGNYRGIHQICGKGSMMVLYDKNDKKIATIERRAVMAVTAEAD